MVRTALPALTLLASACAFPTSGDGADASDVPVTCGDGVLDPDEACDDGAGNDDGGACTTACQLAACGDGLLHAGEEACDDGNTTPGDGCDAACALEACGDGELDVGEACDDGNLNPADGCEACRLTAWSAGFLLRGPAQALELWLGEPSGVAVDAAGNVYVSEAASTVDGVGNRVVRIDAASGTIAVVAGTGEPGFAGDGGPAVLARLDLPRGLAVDAAGNLFIADTQNNVIRRVDAATGTIATVAGDGAAGYLDHVEATKGQLFQPVDVGVAADGDVYIADWSNHRIRRLTTSGALETVVGTGVVGNGCTTMGAPLNVDLNLPNGIAFDGDGNLYWTEQGQHCVRRRAAAGGTITRVAGTGVAGLAGDGGPAASAQLAAPRHLDVTANGDVLIADFDNHRVRRVAAATGTITTVAGTSEGFSGDGGSALQAQLARPRDVAVAVDGTLYVADSSNRRIRVVDDDRGDIDTFAGASSPSALDEGGGATATPLPDPRDAVRLPDGAWLVADVSRDQVLRIDGVTGGATRFAGRGVGASDGDGGPASLAGLNDPTGLAVDAEGDVYISEAAGNRVRRVDGDSGVITTFAGTGSFGFSGDGGPATAATLSSPRGLAIDGEGRLLIADHQAQRVRRISAGGQISTIAGAGIYGYFGDGGAATSAWLAGPTAIAVDSAGLLYIADRDNHRVRVVDDGVITTFAGTGAPSGGSPDGSPATAVALSSPSDVEVDAEGDVIIADTGHHRVRLVDADTEVLTTLAGDGTAGSLGDGGAPAAARLDDPIAVALGPDGLVLVADRLNGRVRAIDRDGDRILTVAGAIDPRGVGPLARATLATPWAVAADDDVRVFAGGASGQVQVITGAGERLEAGVGRYPHDAPTLALARFMAKTFGEVGGVALDLAGERLYLSEVPTGRIFEVALNEPDDPATWTVLRLAGDTPGHADGALVDARFNGPRGLFLDVAGERLLVADTGNHVVRAIDLTAGTVTTIAGTPMMSGALGDAGPAISARLTSPAAVVARGDDLYIADTGNHRVRRVAPDGIISTIAGTGEAALGDDGAPASASAVPSPGGVAVDRFGNLYVTSPTTVRLLVANADHVIDGAGRIETIFGATRELLPAAATSCLTGVAVTGADALEVVDRCGGLLVELRRAAE